MGQWSRAELERAFEEYQDKAAEAGRSGDWRPWADQFTEDATYIEHHYGTFQGGRPSSSGSAPCMADYPGRDMPNSPSSGRSSTRTADGWSARSGTG